MKKLLLLLLLIPNLISAEANTVVDEFPIATAKMVIKLKEKAEYTKTLKPWQIDEANMIYKQLISP